MTIPYCKNTCEHYTFCGKNSIGYGGTQCRKLSGLAFVEIENVYLTKEELKIINRDLTRVFVSGNIKRLNLHIITDNKMSLAVDKDKLPLVLSKITEMSENILRDLESKLEKIKKDADNIKESLSFGLKLITIGKIIKAGKGGE